MGGLGWGADYIGPSTFIEPHFACPLQANATERNASRVCDRAITYGLRAARRTPSAEGAGKWAALDHRIADMAAVVPLINPRMVVLASERVGHVGHHAQWYTLLDQVWVR